jgi:iron complex outermembrane receptor protein
VTRKNDSNQPYPVKSLSTIISAICAGIPAAAVAQDAAEGEGRYSGEELLLEEVMVTATKRGDINLQDVPMSITAFTDADITLQGFKRLDDYFGQIPSLSFGRREPGGTNVIMRGCATSSISFGENPTTSVYLDEQPISQTGFNMDPRLVDIERVEALAGPQGTLFGEAAQCGTLRIITNKPDTTGFEAWVDLNGESVKSGDLGYDVSAMVNIPLIQDQLALRLVGFTAEDAGWVDNILGPSPGGTFNNAPYVDDNINSSNTSGARVALRWTPGDNWVIDAQAIFQDTDADGFGDIDLAEGYWEDSGLGKWEQIRFNDETWSDEWYQVALTAQGSLGWADVVITGGYAHRETRYLADSTAYLFDFQEVGDSWRLDDPYLPRYDFGGDPHANSIDVQEKDRISFEARLSSPSDSDSRWSWIAGVFYNKFEEGPESFTANVAGMSDNCSVYYAAYEGCVGQFTYSSYLHYYYFGTLDKLSDNWWHGVYEATNEQKAIFGEVTFDVTENLAITLGGRWYDIETERISRNGTLINPPQTTIMNCGTQADRDAWQVEKDENKWGEGEGGWVGGTPQEGFDTCYANEFAKSTEDGFVPKANISWRINDDKMVFFTYSEGFRSGGANSGKRGTIFGIDGPYHTYDSDLMTNWEIGAKTTWAGGRFQFNITGYHMVWDDMQIEAVDPTANTYTAGIINFTEAEINGFEADFSWIPAANWEIGGVLGYNNAELSEDAILFEEGDEPSFAVKGTRLPMVPDWKAALTVQYNFENQVWNASPYILGVYQYQGDSVNSLEGISSTLGENAVKTHPSYSIFNLRFGLDSLNWSVALYIDNMFNTYGRNLFNERWIKTRLTATRPRTVGINYRYTWN